LSTIVHGKHKVQQKLPTNIQKLTEIQWQYCIKIAQKLAAENPDRHEKTLFIIMIFYWLYPRVSELIARGKWMPRMKHFYPDKKGNWWFKVLDKEKKLRIISVSAEMLEALKRYRIRKGFLSPLPLTTDNQPLLSNEIERPICKSVMRGIVQECFDQVIKELRKDNLADEADTMELATITDLRQTGIWDDINKRGFSGIQIQEKAGENLCTLSTQRYDDRELKERHQSAKNKKLIERF
jgi:integrase